MTNAEYYFRKYYGLWVSLFLHTVILLAFILPQIYFKSRENIYSTNYVSVESGASFGSNSAKPESEPSVDNADNSGDESNTADESTGESSGTVGAFRGGDTAGLKNYYSESTLNVRIKYPDGWAFMDQPKNGKLDAVTFLGLRSSSGEVPYIILEVKEKYLFNPSQFTSNMDKNGYILYYNKPQMLEQQVSQTVYVRTQGNLDYSIKIIVKGEDAFKELQLAFFAMIETFKFGEMQ